MASMPNSSTPGSVICPKCQYQRQPADRAPDYECPKCGVVYAKVWARLEEAERSSRFEAEKELEPSGASGPLRDWFSQRENQILAAVAAGCLLAGYIGGRQHLKYEMAEAPSKPAALAAPAAPQKPVAVAAPIQVKLLDKGYRETELGTGETLFSLEITNRGGRDMRAFNGSLKFTDLLGTSLKEVNLTVNDPPRAGQTVTWEGSVDANRFRVEDQRLRNAEPQNMKVEFTLRRVLFTDGQQQEFNP